MEPKRYKLGDAAKILGVTPATLRRWGKDGCAPIIKSPTGKMFVPVEWVEQEAKTKEGK
jgi:predicted site-specific integrase-resolvase